jgi:branched-chain amino acid aminotransferase
MNSAVPRINIERVAQSRAAVDIAGSEIPFSSVFSDHMLVATFRDGRWKQADIRRYGSLDITPSASSLNYGLSVFEGLKAHRTVGGEIALFRPRESAARLNRSARRLALPEVPEQLFVDGLKELLRLDRAWVPQHDRGALYVRPILFSIDPSVRVKPPEQCLFVIFTLPFTYTFAAPLDLLIDEEHVRAFPGGTGDIKSAGNYAAAMLAERRAQIAGFNGVLWLDAEHRRYVEECGVMNLFFVIEDSVVTPALSGTILPGITRDSAITLLRDMGKNVVERPLPVQDLLSAHENGTLKECFGTATAVTLARIRRIRHRERDIMLPTSEQSLAVALRQRLIAVATGEMPDPYSWLEIV